MRKQKRIESTDSETTPFIAVEIAEVTGEEHPDRSTMNDDADNVETTNEAGGRHRGRLVLRTVNEEEISSCSTTILSSTIGRRHGRKNQAESKGIESTSTETTSIVAVVNAGER